MEKIVRIINDWDPIGFFPMAPKDEYSNEINKIYEYLCNNRNMEVENLAEKINTIFMEKIQAKENSGKSHLWVPGPFHNRNVPRRYEYAVCLVSGQA